ncbi:MAG: hypothetical protein NTX36_06025 [Proteobacteria bacterium]|nr:hypothetical protein [Pseudomonadota bacterium]
MKKGVEGNETREAYFVKPPPSEDRREALKDEIRDTINEIRV